MIIFGTIFDLTMGVFGHLVFRTAPKLKAITNTNRLIQSFRFGRSDS